jgi:hypothetical protein
MIVVVDMIAHQERVVSSIGSDEPMMIDQLMHEFLASGYNRLRQWSSFFFCVRDDPDTVYIQG